jgi:hypothetical protein
MRIDAGLRVKFRPYIESTIRLLESVPGQRPDPVVQNEAENKIVIVQHNLRDYDHASGLALKEALRGARTAIQTGHLGLALAYMREAAKEVA